MKIKGVVITFFTIAIMFSILAIINIINGNIYPALAYFLSSLGWCIMIFIYTAKEE